jgi:ribose transport system permease protein
MTTASDTSRDALWRRMFSGRSSAIWIATIILFVLSPLIAPGSLGTAPLLSMLPFASVLAIAAAGQTLVIQQRGLDLSVPGMMALGAVLSSALPQGEGWPVWLAVILGVVGPGVVGLINGFIVTVFRLAPLVATLGMNALLLGTVFFLANGTPSTAPAVLTKFALARTLGIPNTLIIAIVVIVIAGLLTQKSIIGRRLTAVGVSERAAIAVGIRVNLYQTFAYGFAGICYGAAGVLLAGYTQTPQLFLGDTYLLPTVAAVVLGGTVLTGGLASVFASGIAALFLTQLGQLLRALGWSDAQQLIAQATVLILVVLIREIVPRIANRVKSSRKAPTTSRVDATTP